MLELYHAPRACSAACRIMAAVGGIPITIHHVDLTTKTLPDGKSYLDIHPGGLVAALKLEDGTILKETATILIYLSSVAKSTSQQPKSPSTEYFEMLSWINHVATELHKLIFWVWFHKHTPPEGKNFVRSLVPQKLDYIDVHLTKRSFLVSHSFTAADAYLVWWLFLAQRIKIDISNYRNITRYFEASMVRSDVGSVLREDLAL